MNQALLSHLSEALQLQNIVLDDKAKQKLVSYVMLLFQWNKTQNLTAVRSTQAMLDRHVLDSLALLPYLSAYDCLDVGSGAGLPGIPLAIALPKNKIWLLESRLKRAIFLRRCVDQLALDNATVLHTRLEDYQPEKLHQAVVARAFCPPKDYLGKITHVLVPGGTAFLQVGEQTNPESFNQGICHDLQGTRGRLWVMASEG